ncbi:MAG: M55 family metallopeptidase [Gemmatimonadetes bacterium]|nr:M55 family metallopeptidase [Gemmatimonadota bacterium]NNM04127.1 M55 family metallopeptidase [Gemmatimonadota bacterium]
MKGRIWQVVLLSILFPLASGAAQEELKVFVSVDMEGIAGVVVSEECSASGPDYGYFRRIMSHEANSAVLGAFDAGATEVVVRDSHGSARNILPDLIDPRAKLLRDWSGSPMGMMEGIDESFDAVVFIGYHARAGTADAIIDHTMTGNVMNLAINGQSLPEAGVNALIAGHFDVPVVFVAGDQGIVDQVLDLFGSIGTFATKQGIGASSLGLHPETAQKAVRAGVADAVRNRDRFEPFTMTRPYTMVLKLKSEASVYNGSFFPGAERTGDWELTFSDDNILNVMYAFGVMRR